ncbi:MAG: hypothetical protein Q9195_001548 [Heterodermia aff. obscurata]
MDIPQIHNARSGSLPGDHATTLASENDIRTDLNIDSMDTLGLEDLTFKKEKKTRSARRRARLRANYVGTQKSLNVKVDSQAQIIIDGNALSQFPKDGHTSPSSGRALGQDPGATARRLPILDTTGSVIIHGSMSVSQPDSKDLSSRERASAAAQITLPSDRVLDPRKIELGEKARSHENRVMGELKEGNNQSGNKQGPLTDAINQFNTVPKYSPLPIRPLGWPVSLKSPNLVATAISYEANRSPRPVSVSAHTARGLQTDGLSQKKLYSLRSREINVSQGEEHETQGPCQPESGRPVKTEHSAKSVSTATKPLSGPIPTAEYLSIAESFPQLAPRPQHLLLVLDLNGTLIYRQRSSSKYSPRPSLQPFLDYCFANHSVMIWSSATPSNVSAVCAQIFSLGRRRELLGEWGRDTLDLSNAEYYAKTQVYKRLDRIWDGVALRNSHPDVERGGRWGQTNTLLLDDSVRKAQAQPYNLVEVPELTRPGRDGQQEESQEVLGQVVAYLEEARSYENVSAFVRVKKFAIKAAPQWDWKESRKIEDDDDAEDGGVAVA